MDAAVVGLIGGFVGAVAGLLGALIAGWQQRLAEAQRWRQGRADEIWKEERQSLLELTTLIATASQAMAWLAWSASTKPQEAVKEEAEIYDSRMRELLPKIFSAQAAASGLSDTTYKTIQELVNRLIELDTSLGTKCVELDSDPKTVLPVIANLEPVALELARQVVETVHGHLRTANLSHVRVLNLK
jgi:gas vesicle protein